VLKRTGTNENTTTQQEDAEKSAGAHAIATAKTQKDRKLMEKLDNDTRTLLLDQRLLKAGEWVGIGSACAGGLARSVGLV